MRSINIVLGDEFAVPSGKGRFFGRRIRRKCEVDSSVRGFVGPKIEVRVRSLKMRFLGIRYSRTEELPEMSWI